MRKQNRILEYQIVNIWQRLLLIRTELTTEDGESIKIIYPGRPNNDQGADFRDAVIATSHGLTKGDIEIHVKSSDWVAHQHYKNPAYNRVILHVVMWKNSEAIFNLPSRRKIPTIVLNKYVDDPVAEQINWSQPVTSLITPCFSVLRHLTADTITKFLDDAGRERFLAKASQLQAGLRQKGAVQCLYQGIMGALGYSKNKVPFLELANRLPLQFLESIIQREKSAEMCLAQEQSLLLGTAGLLPSQRPDHYPKCESNDEWADKLERLWASYGQISTMSHDSWCLFKIRPNNFPIRRIAAISHLIYRYREEGLLKEIVKLVGETTISQDHGCRTLERGLQVTGNGYWADHADFGVASKRMSLTLLGSRRVSDIIVNVLLPFVYAWGISASFPEIKEKSFRLYCIYPSLTTNTIDRHMREQLGLDNRLVNSARRQQGLIHIYNTLCTQGRCNSCPLGDTG